MAQSIAKRVAQRLALSNEGGLYAHLEDLMDGLVGPFPDEASLQEHVRWCKEVRHDGAELIGIVKEGTSEFNELVAGGVLVVTPKEDKAFDVEKVRQEFLDKGSYGRS